MDYYAILQIKSTASAQEIKQAYRFLAKKYHPDSQEETANHEEIIKINKAYEVLGDKSSRINYDQKQQNSLDNSLKYRQSKSESATEYYYSKRRSHQEQDFSQFEWLENVYAPLNKLVAQIIYPLESELEELSADPFDDNLMLTFTEYLDDCRSYYEQAKSVLKSQPNPRRYAGVAANLYYCLNHISDGIEELERFTLNYDEEYLYAGKQLFNLAVEINQEASYMVGTAV